MSLYAWGSTINNAFESIGSIINDAFESVGSTINDSFESAGSTINNALESFGVGGSPVALPHLSLYIAILTIYSPDRSPNVYPG
jgi:hypothetical protein